MPSSATTSEQNQNCNIVCTREYRQDFIYEYFDLIIFSMADLCVVRMARPTPTLVSWREPAVWLGWTLLWCTKENASRSQSAAGLSSGVSKTGTVFLICLGVMESLTVVMVLMRTIVIQIAAVVSSGNISS